MKTYICKWYFIWNCVFWKEKKI